MEGPIGFEVKIHRIAAEGATVLTERTDALIFGPLRLQFWVCGVFEVHDGRITLWRTTSTLRLRQGAAAGRRRDGDPVAAAVLVVSNERHGPSRTLQYIGYCYGRRLPDSMRDWVRNDLAGKGATVRMMSGCSFRRS